MSLFGDLGGGDDDGGVRRARRRPRASSSTRASGCASRRRCSGCTSATTRCSASRPRCGARSTASIAEAAETRGRRRWSCVGGVITGPGPQVHQEGRPDGGVRARGPRQLDRGHGLPAHARWSRATSWSTTRSSPCKGRLDRRDESRLGFMAQDITVLEGLDTAAAPPLRLQLPAHAARRAARSTSCKRILREHPGDSPVFLHIGQRQGAAPGRRVLRRPRPGRRRAAGGLRPRRRDALTRVTALALSRPTRSRGDSMTDSVAESGRPLATASSSTGACDAMAIQVETRDCAALTDADLDEMASMGGAFDIGVLSKAKEDWVLGTTARIDGKLHGFMFSTLERIGGTPCVLLGLLSVKRTSKRDTVLQGPDGRGLPPGADGLPRRGRASSARASSTPTALEAFKHARRDHPPARPPRRRRGAGLGPPPGQALRRRRARTTSRRSSSRRNGQSGFLDHESLKPEKIDRRGRGACSQGVNVGQGRLAHRPRLDDGRGPRQARRPLNRSAAFPGHAGRRGRSRWRSALDGS